MQSSHAVKFYEDDVFLVESVSEFILNGLQSKGSVIVLATAHHRQELEQALAFGIRPAEGRLRFIDAHEALSRFMVRDWPSEARFMKLFDGLVGDAAAHGPVSIFGEMVAVLWAQGKRRAALRLEELWNTLAARRTFSLLCAYPLGAFASAPGTEAFFDVCTAHNHILVTASNACRATRDT
jgi:hypothetical protein